MNESDDKILAYLNAFSTRALHVVVAARLKAGKRGAKNIEVGDLLTGIVLEDNGMVGNLLSEMHGEQKSVLRLPSHTALFPSEAAGELLARLEKLLPQSEPIGHTIDLPLSPNVEHVFDSAKDVQSTFQHKQIQPLHLLVAVFTQDSDQYIKLLHEVGITKELVVESLRATES
jgi:ATP-dependent Clp protease ATP-binding subunit ClpA